MDLLILLLVVFVSSEFILRKQNTDHKHLKLLVLSVSITTIFSIIQLLIDFIIEVIFIVV